MKLLAYTIHDNKALTYSPPFYAATDAAAVRMLQDTASDSNTSIGRHPADFVLYCVGTWDDQNAEFAWLSPVRHIIDAISLVNMNKHPDLFRREPAEA